MSEIERRTTMSIWAFACAVTPEMVIADCREPERRTELRVALDCLFKQVECCPNARIIPG
jgi:hypothetical protein